MTSGCNQAVETCFTCLADPGDNILIPRPSFSLFDSLCAAGHIEPRFYNLRSDKGWEIDFEDLKKNIDERTRAVLINNPSNPCGTVFSREHLLDLIAVCEEYHLPIISDEIYAGMVSHDEPEHHLSMIVY